MNYDLNLIPSEWLPSCPMARVHIHWTGGVYTPNSTDLSHYHMVIDGDGKLHKGKPSILANSGSIKDGYAAHTLGANTGAIGISICSMGGDDVKENPFVTGKYPIKRVQWDTMVKAVAQLCKFYKIPITPKTVLTHAEVQPNLGILQKQKWDITKATLFPHLSGYKQFGDLIRSNVTEALYAAGSNQEDVIIREPIPASAQVEVTVDELNFRASPYGDVKSKIPQGTICTVLMTDNNWLQVKTPAGYVGWIYGPMTRPADTAPINS
jgi:hypothetical protein